MANDTQPPRWAAPITNQETTLNAHLANLHVDVLNAHESINALGPALDRMLVEMPAAMRQAAANAIAQVEQVAEAQTHWINQETLKEREAFIAAQTVAYGDYEKRMTALMALQNNALERVLLLTGGKIGEVIQREVKEAFAAVVADLRKDADKAANARAGLGTVGAVAVGLSGVLLGAAVVVLLAFVFSSYGIK